MAFLKRALAVFAAMALTDGAWTMYFRTVAAGSVLAAGVWSGAIVILGGFVVVSYTQDRRLLIPAALGAAAGTIATMAIGA